MLSDEQIRDGKIRAGLPITPEEVARQTAALVALGRAAIRWDEATINMSYHPDRMAELDDAWDAFSDATQKARAALGMQSSAPA